MSELLRGHGPAVLPDCMMPDGGNGACLAYREQFDEIDALRTRVAELTEQVEALQNALLDMLGGWKYIRSTHGDLYGVGWDRAQNKAEAALASQPKRKEQPIEETVEVPCCGYKASINDHPVKWNPWNKVVQCHNCGQIWEALVKQSDRKPDEPNGGAK